MLRERLKYGCVAVSLLAASGSFLGGAPMTALILLGAGLVALSVNFGVAIDAVSLKGLIKALNPDADEFGKTTATPLRGYHVNWVAMITTTTESWVIFRDEVNAAEWRELITCLEHGSVLRPRARQTPHRFIF
jgi:hypothetical protein